MIMLTPGVVVTATAFDDQGQFSVNGQRADANYFTVDGVSANFAVMDIFLWCRPAVEHLPAFSASGWNKQLGVGGCHVQEFRHPNLFVRSGVQALPADRFPSDALRNESLSWRAIRVFQERAFWTPTAGSRTTITCQSLKSGRMTLVAYWAAQYSRTRPFSFSRTRDCDGAVTGGKKLSSRLRLAPAAPQPMRPI